MKRISTYRPLCWSGIVCACLVFVAMSLSSCVSRKDITYFQPASPSADKMVAKVVGTYVPRIKPGDILSITVSSLSPEANAMFNLPVTTPNLNQTNSSTIQAPITGFVVDLDGTIALPFVGRVKAAALTVREFVDELTSKLGDYLQSPTVTARIANYQISVLGEVARPSVYTITNESITLPEALAMAGDVTVYGRKRSVLIIRETDGQREFARIDLTGRELFDTPYYYLHSGDVIYVEPLSGKATSSDRSLQLIPVIISSVSMLLLIFNTFK